ncbi:class I adenylate-forming enzyme family protein [Ramlibacter sp.]|uniref:class I adenylate-forming enzyme family protein n=1 Tax=Ramlibacter sp. TaxID=1917967 RepID=UPI003D0ED9BC
MTNSIAAEIEDCKSGATRISDEIPSLPASESSEAPDAPDTPPAPTLPGLIRHFARFAPERVALVAGELRLTYGELERAVAAAAAGLQSLGVQRGERVAVLMGNRVEWVIGSLAAMTLGATVVALNTWWTASEIEYALEHSEASCLIAAARYLRREWPAEVDALIARGRVPALRVRVAVGDGAPATWVPWSRLCRDDPPPAPSAPGVDDVALLLYTSGSTSRPKAVQLAHGHLVENPWHIGRRQCLRPDDRLWLAVSLFWGFGCSNALPAILSHGGCLVLQESFDAGEALALIERERCTVVYGTPNMFQAMHEHPDRARRDLSSLRTGTTLGTPEQLMRVVALGATQICNVYGLTEIYGNSHATSADDPLALRLAWSGRPLPGVSQRIVDPQTGLDLPPGEVGELRLKGRVMLGYLKDEAQTRAAFDEQGYFRTGDLAVVDAQGNMQFRGRLKEMVKTGGINVSPAEIESVLMTHPDVQQALVTGVPDAVRDEVLGAVVIAREGRALDADALRGFCRRQLAAYKVPSYFCFTTEDALPLTTTGKVQKNRLAQVFFARESSTEAAS